MLIRCTHKLLKASGIKPEEPEFQPEGLLGEWYANTVALPFPGRVVVMFTSTSTLLTVLAPGRVLRTTVPAFRERLPALLHRLGLPPEWIARKMAEIGDVRFGQARDRRVLGCMNHLAYLAQADSVHLFPRGDVDLDRLEMRLAETPMTQPLTQKREMDSAEWLLERLARDEMSRPRSEVLHS